MARYSTSGVDFKKKLAKYREQKQSSYENLRDILTEFALNRERLSMSDAQLQNVFSAIRKNIDIKTWVFPHPIYPEKEGSVQDIFVNLLEIFDNDRELASKGCRELITMVIKRAHFDAKNELNTYLNQMIQLFSDQKRFLTEFANKSNDVTLIMGIEGSLDVEQISIINDLTEENNEYQKVIEKMEDYIEHINDTISSLEKWRTKISEEFKIFKEKKAFEKQQLVAEQIIEEEKVRQGEQEELRERLDKMEKQRAKVIDVEFKEKESEKEEEFTTEDITGLHDYEKGSYK